MNLRSRQLIALLIATGALGACATPDFDQPKDYSAAMTAVEDTDLGRSAAEWSEEHDGLSGFYPLVGGLDALGVRLELAERAEKSIDLQYFLMKPGRAGFIVANALLMAADRGVRVRFLLDDVFTTASDRQLLLISEHPNIQVRIFNPVSRRGVSYFNFIGDFDQANRRMHNKSFTVDNSMSVVGGRNIADEYFQLENDSVFLDFDVLAIGPIAREISSSFDEYWNHSRALPVESVATKGEDDTLESVRADLDDAVEHFYDTVYREALESELLQELVTGRLALYPAQARVLSDSPDKLVSEIDRSQMRLANDMREVVLGAEEEVIIMTPYYVPGDAGVESVRRLTEKGVRVIIVTNSLASNNHIPVHGAYSRYRKDVIRAGAEVYEARANAAREAQGDEEAPDELTMHTKAFLIDHRYLFAGSLNLDPRSIAINAELGLLIDSPEMVAPWSSSAVERLKTLAYRVTLNDRDKLEWRTTIDGKEVVETKEPLSSCWRRFQAWFLKIAPESQL